MQPDEKTLTLRKPVSLGSLTCDHLDLREPTAGEMEKASMAGSNAAVSIALIAAVSKQPLAIIRALCQRDFVEAADYLAGFIDPGPQTGES
jgi:hypothetical protein